MEIVRIVLSLVTSYQLEIHQMDVKSVFLNDDIHEDVSMQQPPSFIILETSILVCKLNNYLYGIKQAPKSWYEKITNSFFNNDFKCRPEGYLSWLG